MVEQRVIDRINRHFEPPARRLYGCAKRGCDKVNPDYLSYGAYGKSWCLAHPPLRIRVRRWLGEEC